MTNRMTYEIVRDDDPQNPRTEYDNLGTMLYTSRRYLLGDRRVETCEIEAVLHDDSMITLPVFAYIHGNIMLSTGSFGDPWDSGQCGIIYTDKEKAAAWLGISTDSEGFVSKVEAVLKSEVETYGVYVSGEVVGWVVTDGYGDTIDSCFGYFSQEDAESDAKQSLAFHKEERAKRDEHTIIYGG